MKTLHESIRTTMDALSKIDEGMWDDIKHKFRNPNFDGLPPEAFDAPLPPSTRGQYDGEFYDDEPPETWVIHKSSRIPSSVSGPTGKTVNGITIKSVYTDKNEALEHAEILSSINPVGYKVSPAR